MHGSLPQAKRRKRSTRTRKLPKLNAPSISMHGNVPQAQGENAGGAGAAGARDRLSDLPDCLLHAVLSRLKARQVVQTCVLSRRWRRLWLTAPCLDVDAVEFDLRHADPAAPPNQANQLLAAAADDDDEAHEEFGRFEDFADALLLHRSAASSSTSSLDALRLCVPAWWLRAPWPLFERDYATRYSRWVRRGLACSPAALDVVGLVKLPPLPSSAVGTRRLTKLRLQNVLLHQDFADHLTSGGLPVLEDLEMRGTELSGVTRIASGTLKNLVVDSSLLNSFDGSLTFTVGPAPHLASLRLAVQFRNLGLFAVAVEDAPCLARASVHLLDKPQLRQKHGSCYYVQQDKDLVRALCKLLGSLSNVSALELSGFHDMTVVEQHVPVLPYVFQPVMMPAPADEFPRPMLQTMLDEGLLVLHGLRTLVLDECQIGDDDVETLWCFLHHTPAIEKLTLKNCKRQEFPNGSEDNESKLESPPTILETVTNLKLVEIIYKDGDGHEPGAAGEDAARFNEVSFSMIKAKLPTSTTVIQVTKLGRN